MYGSVRIAPQHGRVLALNVKFVEMQIILPLIARMRCALFISMLRVDVRVQEQGHGHASKRRRISK